MSLYNLYDIVISMEFNIHFNIILGNLNSFGSLLIGKRTAGEKHFLVILVHDITKLFMVLHANMIQTNKNTDKNNN